MIDSVHRFVASREKFFPKIITLGNSKLHANLKWSLGLIIPRGLVRFVQSRGLTVRLGYRLREHVSVQEFGTTDRIKNQDVRHTFCQKKQKKQKKHEDGFYKLQGRI